MGPARGVSDARRPLCYLLMPTAAEAAAWAPRNRMTPDRLLACVSRQFATVAAAFADAACDVLVVVCEDNAARAALLARLRGFRAVVCARAEAGDPAAHPRTKLLVWCHTPVRQACPVAARVHLEDVLAAPRVTLNP